MWFAFIATAVVGVLIYKLVFKSNTGYWKKYGIREVDTSPALSKLEVFLQRKPMFAADDYVYEQLGSEKFAGVMDMGKPAIVVKDVDLIKKILIKDFDHFVDRRAIFGEQDVALKRMLPSLQGDEWKGVRNAVSPTFTTGKIRRMMEYFNSVGKEWVDNLTEKAKTSKDGSATIEILASVYQYTIDVIASSVFGMNAGTIKNPKNKFCTMANRLSDMSSKKLLTYTILLMLPNVYNFLKMRLMDMKALAFFEGILEQGLKARMKGEVKRNDFLQLLVEVKKGELKAEGNDDLNAFEKEAQIVETKEEKKQYFTDEIMNSQCLVFFLAGFHNTSNFISSVAYVLAADQDVQGKLRKEVGKIAKEDGSFDYDDLGQLTYLDMVISEVNRMYPAAARLERVCVKDYWDPETGLFVPKGALVYIPVNALHHDKEYYHNADKFDPEHFSPDRKAERSPYVYMPFGVGPRNCIGMRFALIESKAAIAHLVHKFRIEPSQKTPIPVQVRSAPLQVLLPKNLELKLIPVH